MHRLASVLAAALVVSALAGCGTTAPKPLPSSPSPRPTASSVTPTVPALAIPPHDKAELLRATVTSTGVREEAVDAHGVKSFLIRVACTGPAGATLDYDLRDGKGTAVVASTAHCDAQEEENGYLASGPAPTSVQIDLTPHGDVRVGYAIVTPAPAA